MNAPLPQAQDTTASHLGTVTAFRPPQAQMTNTDWLTNSPTMLERYADCIAAGTVVLSPAEQARVVYLLAATRRAYERERRR